MAKYFVLMQKHNPMWPKDAEGRSYLASLGPVSFTDDLHKALRISDKAISGYIGSRFSLQREEWETVGEPR